MDYSIDYKRLIEARNREIDEMVEDFSIDGCMFIENLFFPFLRAAAHGNDYSCDKLVATLEDENGHEIAFILSQDEIGYVVDAVSRKIDNHLYKEGGTNID